MDVDALVERWRSTYAAPRPPRDRAQREAFEAAVRARFRMELPDDYRRFLALTDGGQYDHALLYGIGPEDAVLDRCDDLQTGDRLLVGSSGNLDAYVLHPDGRCDVVNLFDLAAVHEPHPSFTALLARIIG